MSSASSGGGSVAEVRFPGGRHKGCHLAQGKPSDRGDGPAEAGFLLFSRNLSSHTTRSPQLGFVGIPGWILLAKTPPVRIPGWIFQPRFPRRNPPEGMAGFIKRMCSRACLIKFLSVLGRVSLISNDILIECQSLSTLKNFM